MAKVSIGLRGWRFEESDVFTDEGEFRPLDEVPREPRQRLVRLERLLGRPCDACYLLHGEAEKRRCREAAVVYGEPFEEVLLCEPHESDFLYWFREVGGRELAGEEGFGDAFHEWFADGGRAPEGYGGVEHVDTDPEGLPETPDPKELQRRVEAAEGFETRRVAARATGPDADAARGRDADADGIDGGGDATGTGTGTETENGDGEGDGDGDEDDEFDLDLGRDYPTG
jgi:hypothetical protein